MKCGVYSSRLSFSRLFGWSSAFGQNKVCLHFVVSIIPSQVSVLFLVPELKFFDELFPGLRELSRHGGTTGTRHGRSGRSDRISGANEIHQVFSFFTITTIHAGIAKPAISTSNTIFAVEAINAVIAVYTPCTIETIPAFTVRLVHLSPVWVGFG